MSVNIHFTHYCYYYYYAPSCLALKVCKCGCWKQSSAVKSNTVGSLVSWHDRLWLAQLSRKEGHSFGKWHAPGSKMAWKSGCFSYSRENGAAVGLRSSALCLPAASLLPQTATDPHKQPIVTQAHDSVLPWVLIRHGACIYIFVGGVNVNTKFKLTEKLTWCWIK